jgi:uncharacterized membrane protein YsdA (DUF1294 family)
VISNVLKIGALATMLILGACVFVMYRADRSAAQRQLGRAT